MKRNSTLKTYKPLKRGNGFKKSKSSFKRNIPEYVELDSKFSKIIIGRDGKCLRCGSTYLLSCSHYIPRAVWSTRYDEDNCITLCIPCHNEWESKKDSDYKDFMIDFLGYEKFQILLYRSSNTISKEESMESARIFINKVVESNEIQY